MIFNKKKEKEIVATLTETTSISPAYFDTNGNEIPWNSGGTYSRVEYKKIKKFRIDSYKYYNKGYKTLIFTAVFLNKEEAEKTYNYLLDLNGESSVENIINKKSFKK